jgi:prolipoprotein diacylglyceryltransferase
VVPAGIIGGRIYFDITTPMDIPHVWYGPFAVWTGGLGIWGGVALAAVVGVWRLRRLGVTAGPFANAIAPALLVAQAVGRIGNYFNKELFGKPTTLPWGLELLGGASGSVLSRWGGLSARQRRLLVACGCGAGLAAVYNVPLAGALFTAEILLGSITLP